MTMRLPLGPVMTDVAGLTLTPDDIRRLQHPLTGSVILFSRNFESPEQLKRLTASIHALREPPLPIAVDHEGGRVQRFRLGFTAIPPMRALGEVWAQQPSRAAALAEQVGYVLARELIDHGVDFSFAPVLDLDWGESAVIGNRSFNRDPRVVAMLAARLSKGMAAAGMGSVGKHFPGHGFVRADSHHEIPVDERSYDAIVADDMIPFADLSLRNEMSGVMPAHVIYPAVDSQPAGFSKKWLMEILRGRLGFAGIIFSDDLSMEGASVAGNITQRAHAALDAGCDIVLICNDAAKADELLAGLTADGIKADSQLSAKLRKLFSAPASGVGAEANYEAARNAIAALGLD